MVWEQLYRGELPRALRATRPSVRDVRALNVTYRGSSKPEAGSSKGADTATYTPVPNSTKPAISLSDSPLSLHSSLSSFLEYAEKTNLSTSSTVFRGTKYEYTCLATLGRIGFALKRVGGAGDAGIDLLGSWHLPNKPEPLHTLVQCKFLVTKSISPVLVRELEGVALASNRQEHVRVLCTPSLATRSVREAVRQAKRPIILATIGQEGWLEAIVWNVEVEELLHDVRIGMRYVGGKKEAVILVSDKIWAAE